MIGQTLSHYRIIAPLGRGAMGEVYEGEDVRLGRRVAIKVLPADVSRQPDSVERFQREARIISSLNHPNICTLFDIGEHDGRQFMVMELLEGQTLAAGLAGGPLPLDTVLALGSDAAAALDAAHRQGVVHRDIKPANLFVTSAGPLKALDFGVAKLSDTGASVDATTLGTSGLTMAGTAVGTVIYMSPEQARGEAIDGRSDLFSLGVVLYEMATGRAPFAGATAAVIFEGILSKTPAPPSSLRPDLPAPLDAIILRALEKDPARRYQSAAELRADLQALRTATDRAAAAVPFATSTPAPAAPAARPRRSRLWWLAAPVATAAVIAAVVAWQSSDTPALQAKDLVLLAEPDNRTGDAMFDGTVGEALAVQLRQSPFLNLVPDQRVMATLRLMQRPMGTRVDAEVGREVCQRVGARALLTSAIASLGSSYVITLGALDCVTGDTLAQQQTEAPRKEDVIRELGTAARTLREHLGESLMSIARYDANIEQATTPSLEALKSYSQAITTRRTQGDLAALPLFRRAVELDPDFALAHARMGTSYSNVKDLEPARQHTARAFELRSKVSELERLYIEARYYTTVKPDTARAMEAYRVTLATYPNDYTARVNLSILLKEEGNFDEAVTMLREATRIAPEERTARINLAQTLIEVGRFDEARTEAEQGRQLRDDGAVRQVLVGVAIFQNDAALEQEQRQWAQLNVTPRESLPVLWQAAAYRGQLREAERLMGEIETVFDAPATRPVLAQFRGGMSATLAVLQQPARARHYMQRLEQASTDDTADDRLVTAFFLRDAALARRALPAALANADGGPESHQFKALQALGTAASGKSADALAQLGPVQYRVGQSDVVIFHALLSLDVGRPAEALRDLEWLRDHGRRELSANAGAVRFYIGRALEGLDRKAEARKAYSDFLTFWSQADRDLPMIVEAQAAVARIGS